MATDPEHVRRREAATIRRPFALFDAVAKRDYETIAELYAKHATDAIVSFLNVKSRWSSSRSSTRNYDYHSEEKLDEFLQHVTYRDSRPSPSRYHNYNFHHLTYPTSQQPSPFSRNNYPDHYHHRQASNRSNIAAIRNSSSVDAEFHAMIDNLNDLLKSEDNSATGNSGTKSASLKSEKEQEIESNSQQQQRSRLNSDEVDLLAWESSTVLSNSRPSSSFVVRRQSQTFCTSNTSSNNRSRRNHDEDGDVNMEEQGEDEDDEEQEPAEGENAPPPLFDGGVANATPPPIAMTNGISSSAGAGTILHLACAIDSPFALAILLIMGADAAAPHTAFRRLMMHEASCCGSTQCLELLLELGQKCAKHLAALADDKRKLYTPPRDTTSSLIFPILKGTGIGGSNSSGGSEGDNALLEMRKSSSTSSLPANFRTKKNDSFLNTIKKILDLSKLIELGQMSELDAARSIIPNVASKLSTATMITLKKSCCFTSYSSNGLSQKFPESNVLNSRLQPGYADGHGNTPLHWAAFKNETGCVSLLLKFNADSNARAHPSGWTPLHDAAYSDASDSVELLLDAGADVDARANSGATPLCFAAQEDASRATKSLLDRGADISARCCGGNSNNQPTGSNDHEAGDGQQHDLAHGPFGQIQNNNANNNDNHHHHGRFSGYTPLHYCAHYNAHRAAKVLLTHRMAANAMEIPDLNNRLPIHVAVARGSSDVLRELLHSGARVDTRIAPAAMPRSAPSGTSSRHPLAVSPPAPSSPIAVAQFQNFEAASSPPRSPATDFHAAIAPVSSPILRSMIPARPVTSSKPWNCLSQRSIDECRGLIAEVEQNWDPARHLLFTPADRRAVFCLLRVGKRLEQNGTGIFLDLWPLVLSFCGRGWFDVPSTENPPAEHTLADAPNSPGSQIEIMALSEASSSQSDEDEHTQFPLDR